MHNLCKSEILKKNTKTDGTGPFKANKDLPLVVDFPASSAVWLYCHEPLCTRL